MNWITDQIAIGDANESKTCHAEVDVLLCLTRDCCENRTDCTGICISLHDGPGNSKEQVMAAVDYLGRCVDNGLKVLVHCQAGRSRSVAVVAAYLMKYKNIPKRQALAMIAAKRQIFLSDGIEDLFRHVDGNGLPTTSPASLATRINRLLFKKKKTQKK